MLSQTAKAPGFPALLTCQKETISCPMCKLTIFSSPHNWGFFPLLGSQGQKCLFHPTVNSLIPQRHNLTASKGTASCKVPSEKWRQRCSCTWRRGELRHVRKRKPGVQLLKMALANQVHAKQKPRSWAARTPIWKSTGRVNWSSEYANLWR